MIREHNLITGEIIDREMTEEELEKHEAMLAENAAQAAAEVQKAADRAALLEKLGITEDEARLLLG